MTLLAPPSGAGEAVPLDVAVNAETPLYAAALLSDTWALCNGRWNGGIPINNGISQFNGYYYIINPILIIGISHNYTIINGYHED